MLITNNGAQSITMNLRDGSSYVLTPGVPVRVPDAATTMIDDSAYLIGLFNAGTLTVTTDAGGAFAGFPTTVNAADSAAGKALHTRARVGGDGTRTLIDETGAPITTGGSGSVAVQDEGTQVVASASAINFRGAGVSASAGAGAAVNVDVLPPASQLSTMSNWGTRVITLGSTFANGPASIFLGGTFLDDGTDSGTEHVAIEVGEFHAIQLIFQGASTSPLIIAGAKVLSAGDFSDKVQDAAFIAGGSTVTFGGSSTARLSEGGQGGILISDPIPIQSVPRTDIPGAAPALFARIRYSFPQGASSVIASYDPSGSDGATGARQWWAAGAYGDKLSSALGRTPSTTLRRVLVGIRYLSPNRVMTVAVNGTSLTNNNTNTLARQPGGWWHKAAVAVSTPTRPVEVINIGFSTNTSTQYAYKFAAIAQKLHATHFLIEGASVNDGGTGDSAWSDAVVSTNLRNVLSAIQLAERLWRARIGIWNGYPRSTNGAGGVSALTAASDGRRLSYLARLAALGYDFADTNSLVADNQTPQSWQTVARGYPADLSGDGIHPNEVGDTAALPAFQSLFARWAAAYFA